MAADQYKEASDMMSANFSDFLPPPHFSVFGTDLFYEIPATSLTTSAFPWLTPLSDSDIIYGSSQVGQTADIRREATQVYKKLRCRPPYFSRTVWKDVALNRDQNCHLVTGTQLLELLLVCLPRNEEVVLVRLLHSIGFFSIFHFPSLSPVSVLNPARNSCG